MTEDTNSTDISSDDETGITNSIANIPSSTSITKKNHSLDYAQVTTVSHEEFALLISTFNADRFTLSDAIDIKRIELMLDVKEGTLKDQLLYLERYTCGGCGKSLSFSDFVYTATSYANHSKSLVLHTIVGNKLIRNEHRRISCTNCNTLSVKPLNYMTNGYVCCNMGNI